MSASSLFSRLPACGENTSGKPSSACFFHCAICVGWTPYSAAISLAVFCPLIASKATRVFSSALYRFRCTDIVFLLLAGFSIQLFYLIDLSSFLVPSYRLVGHELHRGIQNKLNWSHSTGWICGLRLASNQS